MKFIKDILTGIDGKTYGMGRVSGLLGLLAFLGNSTAAIMMKSVWDQQAYAMGCGASAAGLGILLKLKEGVESK